MDTESIRKILVRAPNHLGDSFLVLPSFRALRKACPQAQITVLVAGWLEPFWAMIEGVDAVVSFTPGGGRFGLFRRSLSLRREGFDVGVLFPNSFSSALSLMLAGAKMRLGYDRHHRRFLLTHPVEATAGILSVHETRYHGHVLSPLGIEDIAPETGIRPPHPELERFMEKYGAGPLVGYITGSARAPAKEWPVERFAEVAGMLSAAFPGYGTVLFGKGAGEEKAFEAFHGERLDFINLWGRTSLRELLAGIAACRLVVTNDTGPMHAAAALGVPLVAVFGSTDPATTRPLAGNAVIVRREVPCAPCVKKKCPYDLECMKGVTPGDVYQACLKLLPRPGEERGVRGRSPCCCPKR
jgi:heptosyltransferase-2